MELAQNRYLDYLIDPSFQEVKIKNPWKRICFYKSKNKRLQHYDSWMKLFWSIKKGMVKQHIITFERSQLVKEMITQLVVWQL